MPMIKVISIFLIISSVFAYADIPCSESETAFSQNNSDLVEIKREVVVDDEIYFLVSFPAEHGGRKFSHAFIAIGDVDNPEVILSLISHEKNGRRIINIGALDTWKSIFTVSATYGRGCIGLNKTMYLNND